MVCVGVCVWVWVGVGGCVGVCGGVGGGSDGLTVYPTMEAHLVGIIIRDLISKFSLS